MVTIRAIVALCLFTTYSTTVLATPIEQVTHLRAARADAEDALYQLYPRQEQQALSQPVTFQTVTTTETQAGTIITTCNVTLSPVTAADGSTQIRQEKQCKFEVSTADNSSSSSSTSNGGQTSTTTSAATETATESQETQTQTTQTLTSTSSSISSSSATATGVPAVSEIGVGVIPVSSTGTVSASSSLQTSASATSSGSAPPAVSVIGPGQIPQSATGTVIEASAPASTSTSASASLVTSVTTLSDGQVSTSISTPSAAAAEQQAATTPGQKLEVLPIGLGVFAGVSVIALIVVGLVTYERTKYRKAFRQRKLAEAGANMGYGGMAERT